MGQLHVPFLLYHSIPDLILEYISMLRPKFATCVPRDDPPHRGCLRLVRTTRRVKCGEKVKADGGAE